MPENHNHSLALAAEQRQGEDKSWQGRGRVHQRQQQHRHPRAQPQAAAAAGTRPRRPRRQHRFDPKLSNAGWVGLPVKASSSVTRFALLQQRRPALISYRSALDPGLACPAQHAQQRPRHSVVRTPGCHGTWLRASRACALSPCGRINLLAATEHGIEELRSLAICP